VSITSNAQMNGAIPGTIIKKIKITLQVINK
jgi:hypothetical protein